MTWLRPRLVLLGKQGAGKGTQCVASVASTTASPMSPRATCSGRRPRREPRSASRPSATWTPASSFPTRSSSVSSRSASCRAVRSATASCSTASRARCTRPSELDRVDPRRPPARPRRRPRRAARDRARPASPVVACARAASGCTTSTCRPSIDWICDTCGGEVRPARRRHRGGGRAPARAVRRARPCRSSTTTATAGLLDRRRRRRRGRRGLRARSSRLRRAAPVAGCVVDGSP